jgi:hypothetical protein
MEHIEKATQGIMNAWEEFNHVAREHMDATLKAATAMTKGMEDIMRNTNGLFQESMMRTVNAGKTLMGAKNVQEVASLHTEFMKDFFDCWATGTGKISEISARMTQDTMTPMAEHANNTMSKIAQKAKAA